MKKWIGLTVALGVSTLTGAANAAPFAASDLAVLQAAASVSNTTCSIVEINRTTANQTPAQSVAIESMFRISGSATSTGYLSHTNDGTLLTFNGAESTNTSANANTLNPRNVATLDVNAAYTLQTSYTGVSGNQTRSATSLDKATWFIADQGGLYTNSAVAADPAGNYRGAKAFGGAVYVGRASATLPQVSTVNTPTGGTVTGLPGLPNGTAAFQDFYLIQSGSNGSAYDVLYLLSATSNTAGTLEKYSLVSGTWTSNGSVATTYGGFGLAAAQGGTGAALFVTTGLGALTANSVLRVSDTAGYNAAIAIDPVTTTLYTAPAGAILKGVDLAPIAAVTQPVPSAGPFAIGLLGCMLLAAGVSARSRRRSLA